MWRIKKPWTLNRAGQRGKANALSAVMVRHVDIEPVWARLSPAAQILCPLSFPHRSLVGRKGGGGVRGAQLLSEKKAIRECREARLKISQWEQSVPLSAASAWDFPKHDTHSAWVSSACRGDLHILKWRRGICDRDVNFSLLVRLFGSTPDGCRGWPSLQAGRCKVLIRLLEAFQRRIPGSAKSQRRRELVAEEKKSEMQWQAADYIARRPSHFGGCIAIDSLSTAVHWFVSFTLHEPIACSYNCVIEKGFSWREKKYFSYTNVDILTQYECKISKGNLSFSSTVTESNVDLINLNTGHEEMAL